MSHSLDQFLANQLTSRHVLNVVTDPKRADAVLTDHIGSTFESRLKELLPPPSAAPKKSQDKDSETTAGFANSQGQGQPAGFMSSFGGGGKGTVFLVDLKSRQVVWSTFEKPKDNSSRQLDRTAERIVSELKKARTPKGAKN